MTQQVFFSFCYADIIPAHLGIKLIDSASELELNSQCKSRIDQQLKNTFVTVVIISPKSYSSRHMRYEIIKSIKLGKEILGLRINKNIINPFSHLAIRYSQDGNRVDVFELVGRIWKVYKDLESYPVHDVRQELRGKFFVLSELYDF